MDIHVQIMKKIHHFKKKCYGWIPFSHTFIPDPKLHCDGIRQARTRANVSYRRIERRRYLCIKLIIKKHTFNYVNETIFIMRYNKFTLPFSYPKHFFYL